MIKIGITGSLSSGKSTVSKIISKNKYPIYSADKEVSKLYKEKKFILKLVRLFNLKDIKNIKQQIRFIIFQNKKNLKKLENLIHPLVRKNMKKFIKMNKKKKMLVFEIPLLTEGNLVKFFDFIIFVNSKKKIRLKRYMKKTKNKKLFYLLDRRQTNPRIKSQLCDYVINNNKNLKQLKLKINYIIKNYV